jgi:hypothetical protein
MLKTKGGFAQHLNEGDTFAGDFINLGAGIFNGVPLEKENVKIDLKTLSRNGLIAGAAGTGKTKTLRVLSEEIGLKGIPTPPAANFIRGTAARMDDLSHSEINEIVNFSLLTEKYNKTIDRESAYEILISLIGSAKNKERQEEIKKAQEKEWQFKEKEIRKTAPKPQTTSSSISSSSSSHHATSFGNTILKELTHGFLAF